MQGRRQRGRPRVVDDGDRLRVAGLDRALDVLETLAAHEAMTLTELATHLGQSVATMHRVLSTLETRGYVGMSPDKQEWHIGRQMFRVGSAFLRRTNVVERSLPVMRALMQATGETSNLGIERDGTVLFVSQVETHASIRAFFPPGTVAPLHASGIGKALLSAFDEARFAAYLRHAHLERFTDKTITSRPRLIEELALVRGRGYALDDEERAPGMRCVAAAIRNFRGEAVAGVSVSGPVQRMADDSLERMGTFAKKAAAEISHQLGAPPD